jgi:DNA-binding protein HU-beta
VNKSELVDQIAQRSGLSKDQAGEALGATIATIEEGLAAGEDIAITGFGKFSVTQRSAREGVNPSTGQRIQIAATKAPRFSAGSKLKDAVKR